MVYSLQNYTVLPALVCSVPLLSGPFFSNIYSPFRCIEIVIWIVIIGLLSPTAGILFLISTSTTISVALLFHVKG